MKEKLTLTIEKETKEKAKRYARRKGVSISRMVEDYLAALSGTDEDPLYRMGKNPVSTGVRDASVHHDRYLYTSDE